MTDPKATPQAIADAQALGAVLAELKGIHNLIAAGQTATNQRIDDLKDHLDDRFTTVDKRIDSMSSRINTLEGNERATALRTAGMGAFSGGVVAAVIELAKALSQHRIP
jgi:hypothetical protein